MVLFGTGTFVFSSLSRIRLLWLFHFELWSKSEVCRTCGVVVPYTGCEDTTITSPRPPGGEDGLIIQRRGNGRMGTHVMLNLSLYVIRCVAFLTQNKLVNYISYTDVSLPWLSTFSRARAPCFFALCHYNTTVGINEYIPLLCAGT